MVTWNFCIKLKYKVLNLGVWMSDPYLYYNSIKDNPVCGHLDFIYLKLKYCSSLPLAIQYTLGEVLFKQFMTGTGVKQLPDAQVNFLPI